MQYPVPPALPEESGQPPKVSPLVAIGLAFAAGCGLAWLVRRVTADPEAAYIRDLAASLEEEGAVVLMDLKGSPRPPVLNGRIPDVYAITDDGAEIAVEVENSKSVGRGHARLQDVAFRQWERRSRNRIYEQHVVEGGRGRRS